MMTKFKKNIIDIYAEQGKQWLKDLPKKIDEISQAYHLTDITPVDNMSFNYVAAGFQRAEPIILKLGLNHKALAKEANCLAAFSSHGSVDLIDSDDGMIIMQKADPGITLKSYFPDRENDAMAIACDLITQLHAATIPVDAPFYTLAELLKTLDEDLVIPRDVIIKATNLRDQLLKTAKRNVLLHGDLHHENILLHGRAWRAIDPKGFIGDPVYDACAFLHNPDELLDHPDAQRIIAHRIEHCANLLGFSSQRLLEWLYVKTVLCWAWCLQDNLSPDYFKNYLRLLML